MDKNILIIDDEANMRHMLEALLSKQGFHVDVAGDGQEGLELCGQHQYMFILCDLKMPNMDGLGFLEHARTRQITSTIIMMSAYGTVDQAIETVKMGAYDYISKPFKLNEILLVLRKAEERERLRKENQQLRAHLDTIDGLQSFGGLVGKSPIMQEVFQLAQKVAPHGTTVLITGESGTGKELMARGLHKAGQEQSAPFVAINCGSIPEQLLESELFGYNRGAFTGADRDKPGLFETAHRGTLFLDEIGELPMPLQVKLLRILEERRVRRLGATMDREVQVRVLAATNRNLEKMVSEGHFREDLLFRLNVINIRLPPLRQHRDDIPLLCHVLLEKLGIRLGLDMPGIAPDAMNILLHYDWPGNVRELENVLERALILSEKSVITPEQLPEHLTTRNTEKVTDGLVGTYSLKEAKVIMEKRLISRAMDVTCGNKSRAAQLLEISYPALLSKLKEYAI